MRLYLIGGFLGSGKSTAIYQACNHYLQQHKKVGVITNDQGSVLVDSGFISNGGIATAEILNGCFCCKFNEFETELKKIIDEESPDFLFAEAVGSCADLVATIAKPLIARGFQPDIVFAVFVDASLLSSMVEGNASFLNEDVRYLFRKQIEEADILVISKMDLLEKEQREIIEALVETEYPNKKVLFQNSYDDSNISSWLFVMENFNVSSERSSLEIDYEIYARGELSLAWLDETILFTSTDGTATTAAFALTQLIYKQVLLAGYPVGHLKFLVDDGKTKAKISYTTINRRLPSMELMDDFSDSTSLLVNARIQASPEDLDSVIRTALEVLNTNFSGSIKILQSACFKPGIPVPVWRL